MKKIKKKKKEQKATSKTARALKRGPLCLWETRGASFTGEGERGTFGGNIYWSNPYPSVDARMANFKAD